MADSYWKLALNEAHGDDIDRQPARKKTKVDHNVSTVALTDIGCGSLDRYTSPLCSINNGSINGHDSADSSMCFDLIRCHPEEPGRLWDNLSPIYYDSMVPNTAVYDCPSGHAEQRTPALPGQMIDGFAMDFTQSGFGRLDVVTHGERPINDWGEDSDEGEEKEKCEDPHESFEDVQVAGVEQDEFIPDVCFGMV